MTDSPSTRASLLLRIRDPNDGDSWARFMGIYSPLIMEFLQRRGLQGMDAEDITQDVLARVATAIKGFDYCPDKGTFRSWLFTLVQNRVRRFLAERRPENTGTGDTQLLKALHNVAADSEEDEWNREYQRSLLTHAAADIRAEFNERTWQAFWSTAVLGHAAPQVGSQLGVSVAAVYMAKHRVTKRLRERIQYLEGGQP